MRARRTPGPGTEGRRFRYPDTCANCGEPIVAELTGVLATGDLYDWRHKDPWSAGCGGRVDRYAPEAIPADEAGAECTVHGKVTRLHDCDDGGTVTLLDMPGERGAASPGGTGGLTRG